MKKLLTLTAILIFVSIGYSQSKNEKFLSKKSKEIQKELESKYNEKIIINDCTHSFHENGTSLLAIACFESNTKCKSRILAHYDNDFKVIKQIIEQMDVDRDKFLRIAKAKKSLTPILSDFTNIKIEYTPTEFSIKVDGDLNDKTYQQIENALNFLGKEENKDLLMGATKPDNAVKVLQDFYLDINCTNADTSLFPYTDQEIIGIVKSQNLVKEKNGGNSTLATEYNITTTTKSFETENMINLLQRRIIAVSELDASYRPSAGGYSYVRKSIKE